MTLDLGSNTGEGDLFGGDVALSADGDTLAVGAFGEDSAATGIGGDQKNDARINAGAAYVFARANKAWSQQTYLKASNTGAGDGFGISVGLSADGDTLAVGAYREASAATGVGGDQTDDAAANAGAVYVFARTNKAWTQQAYIKASNTGMDDYFAIKQLERICRYLLRPPFAHDAVTALPGGRVRVSFKAPWRSGTAHADMDAHQFLARL